MSEHPGGGGATTPKKGPPRATLLLAAGLAGGGLIGLLVGTALPWSLGSGDRRGAGEGVVPPAVDDGRDGGAAAAAAPKYLCPMHPSVTSDRPSDCPLCGMKLVRAKAAGGAAPAEASGSGGAAKPAYLCPMHPSVTSDGPSDCPLCGMKLVRVPGGEGPADAASAASAAASPATTPSAGAVPGLATVYLEAERQQLIGLRTATVRRGLAGGSWRTVGRVQVDQTRVRKTNVKVEGYVERVFVDFVGRAVTRGEPLFTLYSPSLFAAQQEYLLARRTSSALGRGAQQGGLAADFAADGEALVASARRKLELWDVPADELARIEAVDQPSKVLTFRSPIAGVVTAKNVVEGASLRPGDTPYEITDLGVVWVMADAYEVDLPRVRVGMGASLTVQSYPGRVFKGKVAFVEPMLDAKSRTVKVHVHFPNPAHELKPEMYGDVTLEGLTHEGLLVPADAVVHAGTRDVVFVALGDGRFQPRLVTLAARQGDDVEVRAGLAEGDAVVTRANFLVDSESQLRASLSAMGAQ